MKFAFAFIAAIAYAHAQSTSPMLRTAETLQLDGRLDEPFWRQAQEIELTQQAPRPGEPTPFRTTVRMARSDDTLYFAFACSDPSPNQIAVHTKQRDGDVTADDFVSMALDTYGDRRTGYFFRINASAARVDGLIAGPEDPSLDWDGIWDARTQRTPDGWTAEIAIPSRTLNFTRGLDTWGANIERARGQKIHRAVLYPAFVLYRRVDRLCRR